MNPGSREWVSASRLVSAPAARIYAVLADYRTGHPSILPPRYFGPIEVLAGGVGAGTEIRFVMRMLGTRQTLRGVVSEPDPGHILCETYPDSGTVTTFTVTPAHPSSQTTVTIATGLPTRPGLRGWIERRFAARYLRRVFAAELERLASAVEAGD